MNKSVKHFDGTPKARKRREGTIVRLKTQLKAGTKPSKETPGKAVELSESDIKRINKELTVLETRS